MMIGSTPCHRFSGGGAAAKLARTVAAVALTALFFAAVSAQEEAVGPARGGQGSADVVLAESGDNNATAAATGRLLQASALGVCADVRFAGRETVAAGGWHTCALSAVGGVACWGLNGQGQTDVPAAVAASGQVAVAAGAEHSCALSIAGRVTCWTRRWPSPVASLPPAGGSVHPTTTSCG